jgi:F-type H+-transporting ATPase subunit b
MPIDWFTVIAQSINFVILLWLLKRFLYQPIVDGLDAREAKIAGILQEADKSKTQAHKLQSEYAQKLAAIEKKRREMLSTAKEEADAERQLLLDAAHVAADDMLRKRLAALQHDLHNLKHDIMLKSVAEVYALCRRILTELADSDLEALLFNKLLQRLQALDSKQTTELQRALTRTDNSIVVRSVFELSTNQKKRLQQFFQELLGTEKQTNITLSFSLLPDLINGIELSVSGWKLPWSMHNYLAQLQQHLDELLLLPQPNTNKSPDYHPACKNPDQTIKLEQAADLSLSTTLKDEQ